MANEQIQKLKEKVDKDPKSTLFVPLAEEYRKAGQVEEAIEVLKAGIERQPNYMSARVSLGKIYLVQNMKEEAREEFERVVKAIPDNLFAQKKLAEIYREAGELENAIEAYRTVLSLSPVDEESQAILQSLEEGGIPEAAEKEQRLDADHEESEEEASLEEEEFIGEEVMPVELPHAETAQEPEERELVLSLADKDALEETVQGEEGEVGHDEHEEALGPASVTVMDVIEEEPEEPPQEAVDEAAPVEKMEPAAEVVTGPEAELAKQAVEEIVEEALAAEEAEPGTEAGTSPEEVVEGEEPVGVVEIPDEESFADVDVPGMEEMDVHEVTGGEAVPEEQGVPGEVVSPGEESPVPERNVAGAGGEAGSEDEASVARADRLILGEDYAGAFAVYRKLLAENPNDKAVIQKVDELRGLLRLLGKERDIHIARLESFLDAVKRRKDELYRNA
jgi:tetratricopeptide (TPR) repeat protein